MLNLDQGKTCTKNQKCWANQFTSNWPGSSVKNLQCNLDVENPGWCECKSGFMDADDDPKTGCELTIEESVCAYGKRDLLVFFHEDGFLVIEEPWIIKKLRH